MANTSGPWDQYKPSSTETPADSEAPWAAYGGPPKTPEKRTLGAVANDTVIEVANAAAGGIASAANFIKPGNAVSGWIDKNIVKAGEDSQSDVTKAAKQQFREEVQNADGVMGELGAVGKYVVQNPLLATAQAGGSFVGPAVAVKGFGLAGKAAGLGAQGVERAGRAGGAAAGAAMAGGDAAGTAYELSKNAGATEDQAVAAGRQASVIPAVVGGVGGMFGAENLLAGAKGFVGGAVSRALKTGASEALQEGVEEGVTQYEGQRAAMPYDASIDPAKGVAAAAGMGAALGGITGAGTSLLVGRGPQPGGQEPAPAPAQPPAHPPAPGPTLALPAPEQGVIAVGADGTARTPAYQAPGYVGDVTDVQPKVIDPVREQVAAAAERGGALSTAALTAIDTGVTQAMQPELPTGEPRAISLEEADARDQAAYAQHWDSYDADPVVGRYFEDDNDIPDFGAASNVSDEEFLRSLGATDEDIQDAIATARQPAIPQSRPAVDAGAQANEPAGPREGAGGNQAAPGQVATPTNLRDGLAKIRAQKQQEAANAQAATPEAAPASASVPAARPGAVEAAGVERSKLLAGLDQAGATREMVLDAQLKDAQYRLAQIAATTGILPADRASRLSAINQEIADLNAVRDQARELDERDRHEGNTRSMLQGARQELDAAVRAGAVTPEAAQSIAAEAKKTGNAADAAKAVFTAVDSAVAAGPAFDIKAITAKLIPDMTDAELLVAIEHYGPEHKRTAKLQKEVQRRAAPAATPTQGSPNGPQADQAQQAATQPAQAGAAPAAEPATSDAGTPATAGTPEVRALTDGAPTANPGAQAAPAPGAQTAPAETKEQRTQRIAAAGDEWTRMPTVQREALAGRADGLNPIQRKRVPSAAWADLNSTIRGKLADAMGTRAESGGNQAGTIVNTAPVAINSEADQIAEAVSKADRLDLKGAERAQWVNESLSGVWGMTPDEVRDVPEVAAALRKKPPKEDATAATVRFVEQVVRQAEQAVAANNAADDLAESAAPAPSPGVVSVPPAIEQALDADMQAQKARITRLRNEATKDGTTLEEKTRAQTQLKGAEFTLQTMRRTRFDAEDAAIKAIEQKDMAPFAEHITFFKTEKALQELIGAAQAPAPAAPAAKPTPKKKPSADQTRAKADLMAALADLGDILGKNTRMNIMPEQEQKLLPVLTRVLDAAFRLGYAKFKDSAKFALDQIRANLGDEAADALTLDHLQGAYIAMAGGKDGVDTKRAVIDVESKAEIEAHEAVVADQADEADNQTQEVPSDERTTVQGDGPQALDAVAAGAGEGAQGGGRAGIDAAGGGNQRAESGAGADAAGVQSPRGGGSGAQGIRAAGAGDGGRVRKPGRVKKSPEQAAAEQAVGPDARPVVAGEPASAPNIPAADFQITSETRLGQGGEVAKFNDNLAAIRVLKAIEQENRRATPNEQGVLARYVGWGGLANAFPDPLTGEFKPAWDARGKELRALLDDAEFSAARRSTRNAHYTSTPVVEAMWRAVDRLGFKGGLALETSMGVGNFLGLKPQNIPASFVGVEYDNLTARIAQALYPQATVLHSGFQSVPLPENAFALSIGNPPFGSESLRFQYKPELNGTSIHNQFFRASMDALRPGGIQAMVVSRFLMDAKDKSTRLALTKQAKLVAAIRLPDTAFKENARTEVVTDIIILQKMSAAEQAEMDFAVQAYLQRPEKGATAEAERQALAAKVPAWVETVELADPLGGEAMTVNAYFRDNPQNIMGVLERSGSMQHGADITVRLDDAASLERLLAQAVDRLPQGIQDFGAEVLAATEQRHKSMSDALRISLAGQEVGHVQLNRDGVLERVVERETPEGGIEMGMQAITADSPWSDQLMQDDKGRWYRNEVRMGEDGKPVKAVRADGKVTRNNVTQRVTYQTEAEVPDSLRLGKTGYDRLVAAVGLRDSLKRQIMLETADAAKGVMNANRKELAKRYEAFVAKFGPVNRPSNLNLLMTMPDGGLTAALEVSYQPEVTAARAKTSGLAVSPETVKPAPILTERVVPKYEPATSAGTASDALAITLSERGRVDIERIAQLRGQSVEDVTAELQAGEKPLVFKDPETQEWETADAYLSGNVRRKLNAARAARMDANVRALEAVQPAPWGAEDVTVMLGATWVPPKVYADFAEHLSGGKAKVSFSPATNAFSMTVQGSSATAKDWSSEGAPVDYILTRLLNSQPVVVSYKDENGSMKRDLEATTLAQLKAKEISAEFLDWVFKDGERRTALVELFNEKYNTRVVRQRDGSHMALPGKVPDTIIGMRRHQKNVIWRGITDNALLMDHAVGAGKTFAAIARAMERRRMGLSKKPMIVVPNHLIDQWASDVYRLYPGAKVLAAGKKDFEAKRRRRLFGKIATGDWDIVLVPHSSFGFIGIDPATEARYLQIEMDQAMQAVKDAADQAAEDGTDGGRRKPFGVKEAERLVEKIQARMDRLNSGTKDRLLTFEQLGVDDLTIDEAHEFKNLYYSSRMTGVRGMGDKTGSRKANDLYNKVRLLQENPANSVSFLTGTPISNSAVEMYTVMRYLAPKQLKDMGLDHFDAWRAQFVEATAAFEPTESNSLKEVTRLGRNWSNMRSLMDLYYEFTDAVSLEDIQRWYSEDNGGKPFPVPKVKGGDRKLVNVQPTPAQEAMLRDVIAGFDGLDSIEDPYERNAERLRLMDRARKVSLDVRAVDARHPSKEPGGKLEQASQNIKRIYDRWSSDKGTQMVFLDRSVPRSRGDDKIIKEYDALLAKRDEALAKEDESAFQAVQESLDRYDPNEIAELRNAQAGGWNAYQQIKDNLIAMGVPANEIRFIQDANNDEQKQALFDAVNSGKVRVLLGSSQRMGAGTNAQKRLVGLHHIDVTWKPSDIEQREGRIIRQGNELLAQYGESFEVEILAYATERTVDAKMWDLNATKLKMINGIRKYDGAFSMEFEDADSVSMAEMAALASGNPLLLERVKTESEINMLELQERAFRRRMYGAEDAVRSAEATIERNPGRIKETQEREAMARAAISAAGQRQEARRVTVEGKEYESLQGALGAVKAAIEAQQGDKPNARYSLTVDGQRLTNREAIDAAIGAALGDAELFEATINGKDITQHTVAARELVAELNDLTAGIAAGDSRTKTVGKMLGMSLAIDVTAYNTGKGGSQIDASLSLLDDAGATVSSMSITPVAVNQSYVTANLRNPVSDLFNSIGKIASRSDADYLQRQLDRAIKELPGLRERLGQTFPKGEELASKRARLRELISLLDGRGTSAPVQAATDGDTPASFSRSQSGLSPEEAVAMLNAERPILQAMQRRVSDERMAMVQRIVREMSQQWARAPEIIVARNMQDRQIPQAVRDYDQTLKSQGATGEPRGFIYKGKVYLLADELRGPQQIAEVLFHEALGHFGLRGAFGDSLKPILQQMGTMRRRDVVEKAREYGMVSKGMNDADTWAAMSVQDRLSAAEEVLAEMAQSTPEIGFVQRAIAAIRTWLRANVPGFKQLALTDAEIVRSYILPARGFVTRSSETPQQSLERAMMAFSRGPAGGQTETAEFKRWFGDSKVVDGEGKPLVVYHGTGADFSEFSASKIGSAWGADTVGFFFTDSAKTASSYATSGGPTLQRDDGANIIPAYIRISRPVTVEALEAFTGESGLADAYESPIELMDERRDDIMSMLLGNEQDDWSIDKDSKPSVNNTHDGVIFSFGGSTLVVAVDPGQIKSAIGNNGGFDPDDTRINFSRTTAAAKAVGDSLKSITVSNIKQRAGFKATDYLGLGLQALGRRQIVDIYGDMLPMTEYNRLVQQMEADKNEGGAEADQLVTRWAKLPDEGKLADLMHDATLAQIDPAKPYVEGDDKARYMSLQGRFKALSDGAQKAYIDTRDAYQSHHEKVRSAIKERIERSEIKGERKAALLKQMDDDFFKAVKGVYFPLSRFGQYVVTVKAADGKIESVSRAETKAEAEALRSNLLSAFPRDKGFSVGRVMLSKEFVADRDAVGRGFMTELYQVLDKQDMDAEQRAELEDTLGQLYLSSLPDLSWAKHGIHRKGTPGFSQDARRAYAQNMFHGARYLAKLRYSDLMQDELTAMQRHVDDWREVEDFDQNSAQRVVDEMNKRHETLMNPKSNKLSTWATSLGFVFHLGLSPASAMVNLSQTALVAYPIMGAKWGFGKASAALLKASAEAAKGKNDITGSLNEDERAAYDEAVRAGTIDVTMAHDLAGIAQGEDAGVMWKIRPVMRWASFLFHHAERFNRQVTFVAAYRLAREAGTDQKAAFEQATKATYDGHFDYAAANRPRIMQGNVAKVVLLFKQYGQNMVYTLARNAQQAIKAETPEARAQARKTLGGLLATHAAAAGVLGLPMVTTLLAAASMIGGDDDEPWDAKVALQNMLADTFGQKPAEVMSRGLSRLTPWDISSRVGLDKLIFPDVQEGLEGQRLAESAMAAALGPVAGIGINVLKGLQDMADGQYQRGLESMMPAALRGPIKAVRYESEGVQDKTGVVVKDEVSAAGVVGQFLGFSPSEVRNATEGKSAIVQRDRALGERRQELLTKAARATMDKDAEARAEALKEIERFNEKNPGRRITAINIVQSVRNRQKRIDQAEDGVYLPRNRRDAMDAGRFANAD